MIFNVLVLGFTYCNDLTKTEARDAPLRANRACTR